MESQYPQAAAQRGSLWISAELWRYTIKNEPIEDITSAAWAGKVTYNSNSDIKATLALSMLEMDRVTPLIDYVAPFVTVRDAMGASARYQLGLYAVPPGKRTHTSSRSTGTLEGRDVTYVLSRDYPTAPVNYAATANCVAAVISICTSHGLNVNIPANAVTFGVATTFLPDKSWLEIANAILTGIGYYTLWPDLAGTVKSVPYFELATAQPSLELYSGEGSIVVSNIEEDGVYDGLANRVVVYKANTQGAPIISVRTNADPLSPISTVSVGRTYTRLIPDTTITSQAVADAMAKRALEESASYTRKLQVVTLPALDRDLHEVYDLSIYNDHDDVIGYGKWWCDGWVVDIGFRPASCLMTHSLKRVEAYGSETS